MATSLNIECADRSVRWYLTPGQSSRYDIIVINPSGDESVDCSMALDDPPEGGSFEPAAFSLRPRERKTVTLTFPEETAVPRDQRALISVRDSNDIVIASFEHGLISAGGIDCTIALAWKEPILDGEEVRGFVVSCAIKSLSASPGSFALQFTTHPSLEFVDVAPLSLQPGQTATVAIPILWKRSSKDADGNNHPRVVEIGVAVSQGKRTGRLAWDVIESKLAAFAKKSAAQASAAAVSDGAAHTPASTSALASVDTTSDAPPRLMVPVDAPERGATRSPETVKPAAMVSSAPPENAKPIPPDLSELADEESLMSLLVGKPVSPPPGWRGPGRDASENLPVEPPSIYAKSLPAMTSNQPARTVRPPDAEVATVDETPWAPPTLVPPASSDGQTAQPDDSAFRSSALEAAVVGPPPSLARAIEAGKEHAANERRINAKAAPLLKADENQLPTLVIAGTGIIAVALGVFFYLRPSAPMPSTQAVPSVTVPPPVVLETARPVTHPRRAGASPGASPRTHVVSNKPNAAPSVAPSVAARVVAQATQRAIAVTAPPPTAQPAKPKPATVALAPKPRAPVAHRPTRRPVAANPNIIVSVQGVNAHYGPAGNAVRVLWGANGQASAHIQLIDDRGGMLSQTDVNGTRQNALLYVPRTYHGPVFVQVVSIGYQGERVTQSTSLPAFSR